MSCANKISLPVLSPTPQSEMLTGRMKWSHSNQAISAKKHTHTQLTSVENNREKERKKGRKEIEEELETSSNWWTKNCDDDSNKTTTRMSFIYMFVSSSTKDKKHIHFGTCIRKADKKKLMIDSIKQLLKIQRQTNGVPYDIKWLIIAFLALNNNKGRKNWTVDTWLYNRRTVEIHGLSHGCDSTYCIHSNQCIIPILTVNFVFFSSFSCNSSLSFCSVNNVSIFTLFVSFKEFREWHQHQPLKINGQCCYDGAANLIASQLHVWKF